MSLLQPALLNPHDSPLQTSNPYSVITAITHGVAVLLLAAICFCVIMLRKKTIKWKCKASKHMAAVSQQEE